MDNIKELVERLRDWNEDIISTACGHNLLLCRDVCEEDDCIVIQAIDALEAQAAEIERLTSELGAAMQDMKIAVSDYRGICRICRFNDDFKKCDSPFFCKDGERWEWRGPKKEE